MNEEYDLGFVYKNDNGKGLKVTLSCFRGNWYTHLREYVYDGDTDRWFPTKKGIAVKAEHVDLVAHLFSQAGEIVATEFYEALPHKKKSESECEE